MESLTGQRESSNPEAVAADADSSACPRLVLLPPYGSKRTDDFSAVANAKTTSAASCTSTGRRFSVSFGLVPSLEISSFCYSWEDRQPYDNDRRVQCPLVHAAHGDCVLLEVTTPYDTMSSSPRSPPNYFVYQAPAAGRPPSLLLLPSCYIPSYYDRRGREYPPKPHATARNMIHGKTVLLRRGEDDILVAELEVDREEQEAAELCFIRPGRDREWQLKRVPIVVYDDDKGSGDDCQDYEDPLRRWKIDVSFAVGDRFLCWVDYKRGFLFVDMAADELSLKFRYAPLPSKGGGSNRQCKRNLAPTGHSSVRFVDVDSRCCCGDPGSSTSCERGRFLFTVTTWTLKLSMDEPMEWVKDGVLDCEELWAQPGYTGLPHVTVE